MIAEVEGPAKGIYHVQFKTLYGTASIPGYMKEVAVSMHERGYSWLGRAQKKPIPIKGTILVVFQKTVTGPVNRKTGVRSVKEDWAPFTVERLSITPRAREQFVDDASAILDWIENCRENGFPRFTKNCVQYGRACIAYDWCRMGAFFKDEWETRAPDYADKVNGVNVSRLLTFQVCPKLYEVLYELNLSKKSDKKLSADFGTAVHNGVEAWYGPKGGKKFKDGGWKPGFDDRLALETFERSIPEGHDEECKETETTGYGKLLLQRYFDRYRIPHKKMFSKILGTEVTLVANLNEE